MDIKEEQVEELVEYLLDCMDMEELKFFVRNNLTQYYLSDAGIEDFNKACLATLKDITKGKM